jgi:outer membrane autotransporter protein
MVFGVDTEVTNATRVGASFTYARTSIDGDGDGNAQNDIDSYQVTAYGDYTTETYYIEGAVGVARNESKSARIIDTAGLNRAATGEYTGEQYMVSLKGGAPISLGGSAFVTPTAGLSYTHVTNDSYTETGAGSLNLTVNPGDVDALVASLGAKVHTRIKQGLGHIVPTARFGLSYDLIGDEATASSTYQGGGTAFATTGSKVEQFGATIGAGLSYDTGYSSLGINLDFEHKSDFQSATATLEARFKF